MSIHFCLSWKRPVLYSGASQRCILLAQTKKGSVVVMIKARYIVGTFLWISVHCFTTCDTHCVTTFPTNNTNSPWWIRWLYWCNMTVKGRKISTQTFLLLLKTSLVRFVWVDVAVARLDADEFLSEMEEMFACRCYAFGRRVYGLNFSSPGYFRCCGE